MKQNMAKNKDNLIYVAVDVFIETKILYYLG